MQILELYELNKRAMHSTPTQGSVSFHLHQILKERTHFFSFFVISNFETNPNSLSGSYDVQLNQLQEQDRTQNIEAQRFLALIFFVLS